LEKSSGSSAFLIIGITGIILVAIIVPFALLNPDSKSFSKVITVGPVWESDSWICVSDSDFMIYGTLRGLGNSQLEIFIENVGTQSLFALNPGEMETFSVGSMAGYDIIITRTGTVTGFITLQTSADATASCTQS
jgi:hypothetical protein